MIPLAEFHGPTYAMGRAYKTHIVRNKRNPLTIAIIFFFSLNNWVSFPLPHKNLRRAIIPIKIIF